jgi:hypothetical protein
VGINVFTIQVSFADKKNLYPNSIVNSNRTEATFALCASFFILLTYARFKHLRKIAFELIVFLSVADIGSNITYLMGSPERHSPECKAQAILQQFFEMSSIIWTVVIGYMLWENVDKERKAFGGAHFRKKLHTFVWGIAMLTALLPATTRSYGQTGACHILWAVMGLHDSEWLLLLPRDEKNKNVLQRGFCAAEQAQKSCWELEVLSSHSHCDMDHTNYK